MPQHSSYRYAVSYTDPMLSHPAPARRLDKGLGVQPPLSPTTMSSYSRSPYRLPHVLSPARSTPSLDDNLDDNLFLSPPDIYLDTPDLPAYDWKEIRKLEDRKLYLEDREAATLGLYDAELPSLVDVSPNKTSLVSDLLPSSAPASWQPPTISPAEIFYDYDYVRQVLADQARPSSPSVYSVCSSSLVTPYSETKELPSIDDDDFPPYLDSICSPDPAFLTFDSRLSATKRPREEEEEDDDYDSDDVHEQDDNELSSATRAPLPKRRRIRSDVAADYDRANPPERDELPDDDDSGEFRPRPSHLIKRRKFSRASRRSFVKTSASQKMTTKPRQSQMHSKSEDNYPLGPCDCRQSSCASCEMTCWYTFIRGPRKGQLCKRLFDSGRHLDLRRHKISHAVNEWQMLQTGEVTIQEASWYAVEHNGEHKGLICPNGDCRTTFTRYDALRRHMERQTCPCWKQSAYSNLDSRNVKAQIERDSREKYARISTSKHA